MCVTDVKGQGSRPPRVHANDATVRAADTHNATVRAADADNAAIPAADADDPDVSAANSAPAARPARSPGTRLRSCRVPH